MNVYVYMKANLYMPSYRYSYDVCTSIHPYRHIRDPWFRESRGYRYGVVSEDDDNVHFYILQTRVLENQYHMFPYRPARKIYVQNNINNNKK
jgi:hypothetical protein